MIIMMYQTKIRSLSLPGPIEFGSEEGLIILTLQGIKQVNRVMWILDIGCSRHMTGDRALLSNVVEKDGPRSYL